MFGTKTNAARLSAAAGVRFGLGGSGLVAAGPAANWEIMVGKEAVETAGVAAGTVYVYGTEYAPGGGELPVRNLAPIPIPVPGTALRGDMPPDVVARVAAAVREQMARVAAAA